MSSISSAAQSLNFAWLFEGEVAGCAAPMSGEDLTFLKAQGIRAMVRLAYPGKDDYVIASAAVEAAGMQDLSLPVEDYRAPTPEQIREAVLFIDAHVQAGRPVAVSCGAGCGRTGTILACYLVSRGYSAKEALRYLISKRPCSAEIIERTPAQEEAIYKFERRVKAGKAPAQR